MAALKTPESASITLHDFKQLLNLYDDTIKAVYSAKISDKKKLKQALEDDKWRYIELPEKLKHRKSQNTDELGINKEELERLVRWKITHGTNRPFLPALIRRNDASLVQTTTARAFKELDSASVNPNSKSTSSTTKSFPAPLQNALKAATELTGVGPATASLLLSICFPDTIPFFSDESYSWLCLSEPTDPSSSDLPTRIKTKAKLKYDVKEYTHVAINNARLATRLSVPAVSIEKVSYVLGHTDVLPPTQIPVALRPSTAAAVGTRTRPDGEREEETSPERGGRKRKAHSNPTEASNPTKRRSTPKTTRTKK